MLVPEVAVVVHPVDRAVHPTYPDGWRWAVQVGGGPPNDLDRCVGAGHCLSETAASAAGEEVGSAVTKALRTFGVQVRYSYQRLGWDPIPAEADERPIGIWHGENEAEGR